MPLTIIRPSCDIIRDARAALRRLDNDRARKLINGGLTHYPDNGELQSLARFFDDPPTGER